MKNTESIKKEYWENNIKGFAGFYDKNSEENINGNKLVSWLYKKVLFPMEKKYMYQRHRYVINFINNNIFSGSKAADIGCGSGIYVKKMIQKGAFVYAYDYAQNAINLTKENLTAEELQHAELSLFDVSKEQIKKVDAAISIGVLPYVEDHATYLKHILPHTEVFLFNFLNKNNFMNRCRRKFTFLDVRYYSYHSLKDITDVLREYNFEIVKKQKLASGYILETKRINK